MHSSDTIRRTIIAACGAGAVLMLAACDTQPVIDEPEATASAVPSATASGAPDAMASEAATPAAEPLDYAALTERKDPERLLRFYTAALRQGAWSAAALAWDAGAGMTAEKLQKAYKRDAMPEFAIGQGAEEGAAGSLFYEAPVVITFGEEDDTIRGDLTLRRANDVPGAGEAQLAWRIERSTIGPEFE
jgi:hypothetical protein